MNLTGRVVAETETHLTVSDPTRVRRILVSPGQSVSEGQVLIESGEFDRQSLIDTAEQRVRLADARLTQALTRLDTRLRDVAADIRQLERRAGDSSSTSLVMAQSAILQAQADVRRAESDLARLTAPPGDLDIRTADQEVRAAEIALRKAEADRDRVVKGPDEAQVRKAKDEIVAAEAHALQATEALRRLTSGAESRDIQSAEAAVKAAEESLRAAREPPAEIMASRVLIASARGRSSQEREATRKLAKQNVETALARQKANIARAESELERALDRLVEAKQGAGRKDIEVASRDFRNALKSVADARERLDTLQDGPAQLEIDTANSQREGARVALERAKSKRAALDDGPPADLLQATQAAVTGAQAAARAAEANLKEVAARQTTQAQELSDALSEAEFLRSVIEGRADDAELGAREADDPDIKELVQAQAELASAQDSHASVVEDRGSMPLLAPASGVVTTVRAGPGEMLMPGRPALTLVRTSDFAVQVPLDSGDELPIRVGLPARVRLATAPATDLAATVSRIDEVEGGRFASLTPLWSDPLPAIGTTAQVSLSLQSKESALLVPPGAIQVIDGRSVATTVDGPAVRQVEVSIGLRDESDVEVVAGLEEGQIVLAAPG